MMELFILSETPNDFDFHSSNSSIGLHIISLHQMSVTFDAITDPIRRPSLVPVTEPAALWAPRFD
jgi:hypothetical protein